MIFWWGGKNGYVDQFDDWVNSYGWSYEWSPKNILQTFKIHISEKTRKGRRYPTKFRLELRFGNFIRTIYKGSCKSLSDARRKCTKFLEKPDFSEIAEEYYQKDLAILYYKLEGEELKPFCSVFRPHSGYNLGFLNFPLGTYFCINWQGWPRRYELGYWGSCGGPLREGEENIKQQLEKIRDKREKMDSKNLIPKEFSNDD